MVTLLIAFHLIGRSQSEWVRMKSRWGRESETIVSNFAVISDGSKQCHRIDHRLP